MVLYVLQLKPLKTSSEYTATASCDGSEPNNARIQNTLLKPNPFDEDNLSGRTITIDNSDNDLRIDFFTNGTFETIDLNDDGDEIVNTIKSGTYADSTFNDAVRFNFDGSENYSLFVLLDGSLSSGVMFRTSIFRINLT